MNTTLGDDILTAGEAAALCTRSGITLGAARIRQLEREGEIPAIKTAAGWRLFLRRDVESFLRKRVGQK